MKAMLAGFAVTIVIATGAYYLLGSMGFSAKEQSTGQSVRLD